MKYVCSYAVFNLIAYITINYCCYFVFLLIYVLASMVHFLGGYLQRNAFKTNAIKDVRIWNSDTLLSIVMLLTMYMFINYRYFTFPDNFMLVADKHPFHNCYLHCKGVITLCCLLIFIPQVVHFGIYV